MTYVKETLYLLYLLWFKPITFHHRFDVAGADPFLLNRSLFHFFRKKERKFFFSSAEFRRPFFQILTGNLLLLIFLNFGIHWLSDMSGVSFVLGIEVQFLPRVTIGILISLGLSLPYFISRGLVSGLIRGLAFGTFMGIVIFISIGNNNNYAPIIYGFIAALFGYSFFIDVEDEAVNGRPFDLSYGLLVSFVIALIAGILVNVYTGILAGALLIASFFNIGRYILWCLIILPQSFFQTKNAEEDFFHKQLPIGFDELIYLPLPIYSRLVIVNMKSAPTRAEEMVTNTASSAGQKWATVSAGSWWGAQSGLSVSRLADLEPSSARLAQMSSLIADVPSWPRRRAKETSQLLADFSAVAQSLANLETGTLVPQTRLLALERNRQEIETLKARAGLFSRTELAEMGNHWQRLIREHAQEVEQMESRIITGAYQAGSALETGSQLFQGRTDLFKITGEVYADPNRAETLLLIGQQRMGKSSALYQMSDRIPDLHMMFVDCQGAFTGKGDELFAAGLTEAIMRWEKRRPSGIRMETLDIATIEKHPLHHLSIWLDAFADQTQGKRVLLCLDEFDKLVRFVAEGRFSWDVLGKLRGLSQSPGWMVLYSGQFELDAYSQQLSEYVKNVRRVRVSYLKKDEARKLLEEPVPEFGLTWEPDATEAALAWSGCQPFLVQLIGTEIVNRMVELDQTEVTEADVKAVIPAVLDSGDYYFKSIDHVLDVEYEIDTVLREIAEHGRVESEVRKGIITRLVSQEYIEEDGRGHRFRVPLLREWWLRKITDQ